MKKIYILWDYAFIWGLMALRSFKALGLPCSLISAQQIAQARLLGKQSALLVVPGGSARLKAGALGVAGLAAIRQWLHDGGAYLGFCGGAGLALTQKNAGLNICPWERAPYQQRILHMLSGHALAKIPAKDCILPLPVWWPGRFNPEPDAKLEILAAWQAPGDDLWLADLPWKKLQACAGGELAAKYELGMSKGQPLAIAGGFGRGAYILSYAHLETPDSPGANMWLGEIIESLCQIKAERQVISAWRLFAEKDAKAAASGAALSSLERLLLLGEELGIFFRRAPWLWGWRHGAQGMSFNNLYAMTHALVKIGQAAKLSAWHGGMLQNYAEALQNLCARAERHLWEFRLNRTLVNECARVDEAQLQQESFALFGHPMFGGGETGPLLAMAEKLILELQDYLPED